jgi:hypothetical protein
MQRVESEPAMTAMFADHRATVSALASSSLSSSSATTSVLPVAVVSIISLSTIALISALVLSSLVLTCPAAGSQVSGRAGLTTMDTRETLGG